MHMEFECKHMPKGANGLIYADGRSYLVNFTQETKQKRGLLGGSKSRRTRSEARAEAGVSSLLRLNFLRLAHFQVVAKNSLQF